jgi:hypothetical protein
MSRENLVLCWCCGAGDKKNEEENKKDLKIKIV